MKRFSRNIKRTQSVALAFIIMFWQLSVPLAILLADTQKVSAAPVCVNDTAGANDEPGQKDLTKLCVDYAGVPTTVSTTWNWDETGTNGANTLDACNLFDTDGDGNINYAVCVTTQNDPATFQSLTTYSCGDDKIDRCTSPATPVSSGTTSCTVTQQNTDPFPGPPNSAKGDSYPVDTQGACTVQLSTVGGASAKLIDVCSYPSSQPNSDPSDCVIARNNAGKLEVIKNLVPADNTGLFNLQIDSVTQVANVGHNGTTGEKVLAAGNHTVGETAGTSTSLASYSTSITCRNLNGTGAIVAQGSAATLQIALVDDADVVCIITNTAAGSITIVKNAIPDSTQNFGFTSNAAGFANFQLDDEVGANTDAVPESINIPNLTAGTYTFTEAQVIGWYLDQIDCPNITETQNLANGTLSLTITAGQNITCTFTNRQIGQVVVTKQTDPNNDPAQFNIAASPAGGVVGNANQTISDNQSVTYSVKHGTYAISETVPAGWTESSNNCSNLVIDGNTPLVAGIPTRSCTINNTKLATIQIIKNALPNNAQDFSFLTNTLPGGNFLLDDDSGATGADNALNNQKTFATLPPNVAYSVTESTVPGWQLTGLNCDSGSFNVNGQMVSITPVAGQTIICTFSNTKLGSISGIKYTSDADSTLGPVLSGWTIFIDGNNNELLDPGELFDITDVNGSYSFLDLLPGTYGLDEQEQAGWTQIFGPAPVELEAGEESTGNNFGNFQNASINGFKWNDVNGNGAYDNETKLDGWTITLFNDNNDVDTDLNNQVAQTVTAGGGNYSFTNLAPGTYAVCETPQAGWIQTFPGVPACHIIVINESGATNQANFGNQGRGTIQVNKNIDTDGDGQVDQTNVVDWTWDIDGAGNFATGSSQNIAAGSYTVSEDQKAGYHVTSSTCTGETAPQTPSEQIGVTVAPGENVVCTYTNTRDTGTITVSKDLLPVSDTGLFNLQINAVTAGTGANVGDNGTTGSVQVATGQYTIGETAGTNTSLANYSTQYVCLNGRTIIASGSTTTSTTFSVGTGDSITCTITNTRFARVIVQKQTDPDGHTQQFSFNASYDGDGFSLSDGQSNDSGNLLPGTYSVSENTPLGWDLTTAICSDQSNPASISLQPGETVTCVFTNTQDARIVVTKQTNPDGSTQSFNFSASYDADGFELSDGQSNDSGDIDPGTYSVSETVPAGWDLDSVICSDGSAPGSISLQAGETVTCTFTNEQDAHIIVVKQTDPDGSSEVFNFTANYDAGGFALSDGQQNDSGDLAPGIYSVSETVPGGWQLKNAACSDQSDSSAISLSAGETVTCTFNNEQDAHIVIKKQTLPDGDTQSFNFSASYDADGFSLTDGASNNSGDLNPGTYSVSETALPAGWDLDSVVCDDQSSPSSISLQAGETVTCTFTNIKKAKVQVTKYNDYNHNGQKDADEPVLPNWTFSLSGYNPCDLQEEYEYSRVSSLQENIACAADLNSQQENTGTNGEPAVFEGVTPNQPHELSETQQSGWTLSEDGIDCDGNPLTETGTTNENGDYYLYAQPGATINCFVGNYQEPLLNIAKSNNRPNSTTVGDTVTYTLIVDVPRNSGAVFNVIVQDLPPENFEYLPGSWTANSNLRGDIKAAGPTTEPTYGSPGQWLLGRLLPGEIVTLTYKAKIANSVITGTYPDIAFAFGCATPAACTSTGSSAVLANVSTGDDSPFVGTDVTILSPAVIPANTVRLVNTGASEIWRSMIIAGFIILVTLSTFVASRPQKGGRS